MIEKFLKLLLYAYKMHDPYLWGAQGELVNQLTDQKIYDMEISNENALRVIRFIKMLKQYGLVKKYTRAFDCSGLVCYCLVKCGRERKGFDTKADNLFALYPHSKKIAEGMLVHRRGHIAVYIGYGHVIEARGRDWGVVISPYDSKDWDMEFADPFTNLR